MSKAHRGKGTRELVSSGRGTCPICGREHVKVLYEVGDGDNKIKICKTCKAAVKNGTKKLPEAPAKPAEAKAAEAKPAA
jgi:RNA polymerase subunit RPABC4/transcription elongation factor Spt4